MYWFWINTSSIKIFCNHYFHPLLYRIMLHKESVNCINIYLIISKWKIRELEFYFKPYCMGTLSCLIQRRHDYVLSQSNAICLFCFGNRVSLYNKMIWNSPHSSGWAYTHDFPCLGFWNSGTAGMQHHPRLQVFLSKSTDLWIFPHRKQE